MSALLIIAAAAATTAAALTQGRTRIALLLCAFALLVAWVAI